MTQTEHQQNEMIPVVRTVVSPVDSLTDALKTERRLIDELISVMKRQRSAVGDDDLQAVDDSVFATHRVLVTLSEARHGMYMPSLSVWFLGKCWATSSGK